MSSFPASLPTPRTPDPASAPPLRWGILAPGRIAVSFVSAVQQLTGQRIVAAGSRSAERARTFADRFGIERSYGSYEELVADQAVDVVYVASPHSEHAEQALLAIGAGKHVLVEKAFTQNAQQAVTVMAAAEAAGVVALEAMWTRFLPSTDVVRQLLADGVLGDLVTVAADHGQYFDFDPSSRLFDPALAGGALLDLGIYPVSFASFVLGTPTSVTAVGSLAATGVDGQAGAILGTATGAQALVTTTLFAKSPTTATITGTEARVEIPGDFYGPQPVTLISRTGDRLTTDETVFRGKGGLAFQAAELARVITDGRLGSDLLPAAETISILRTVDEIRRQIGAVLPGD